MRKVEWQKIPRQNNDGGWRRLRICLLILVGLLLASCGAGGGAVSVGGLRWRTYWPPPSLDRYEPVVYPSRPAGQ